MREKTPGPTTVAHPLRPLVLAISVRMNDPRGLLSEVEGLQVAVHGEQALLAAMSMLAARTLARTAIAFNHADDVAGYADTDGFRSEIMTAGTALMRVAMMPWPTGVSEGDCCETGRTFRKACLDLGAACFALGSGRVPRPDKANLLTSLTKAIPRDLRHAEWTYHTLRDYGGEPSASEGTVPNAP